MGGSAYDITDFADPLAVRLAGRWVFDGPNCWNLCLVHRGIAGGLEGTRDTEFRHWMASPLSQEITNVADLKPGDVVAFRKGTDEVHGAIYISPRILLTKNGTEEVRPYRLMDLNEVYNIYRPMSDDIKLFRVKPIPDVPELAGIKAKLKVIDAKISFYAMQDEALVESEDYQTGARNLRREVRAAAKELKAEAQAGLAKTTDPTLKSVYEGLILRFTAWGG